MRPRNRRLHQHTSAPTSSGPRARRLIAASPALLLWLAVGAIVMWACPAPAQAQQRGPALDARIRQADDATGHREQIERFLEAQFARLTSEDRAAVTEARNALSEQVQDASGSFRDFYSDLLARRLDRVVRHEDTFIRLNAGILTERIARATQHQRLLGPVTQLVGDRSPGVSYWGIKAAYYVLPRSLENQRARDSQLVPAIVAAVQRFPDRGLLAEEAYRALSLWINDRELRPRPAALDNGIPVAWSAIIEILEFRMGQYGQANDGSGVPADPLADQPALTILTNSAFWQRQNQDQRNRTISTLRNLLFMLGRTALEVEGTTREQLVSLLRFNGSAFIVISNHMDTSAAAERLNRSGVELQRTPIRTGDDELRRVVNELLEAIEAAFPRLPDPPGRLAAPPPPQLPGQ